MSGRLRLRGVRQAASEAAEAPLPAAGAGTAARAWRCNIDALPDALLGRILELAVEHWSGGSRSSDSSSSSGESSSGDEDEQPKAQAASTLLLVSKRWQRAYLSSPALHSSLVLRLPDAYCTPEQARRWALINSQRVQRFGRLHSSVRIVQDRSYIYSSCHTGCMEQLAGMLAGLQPGALTSLRLDFDPSLPGMAGWLRGSMASLTHLMVGSRALQPDAAAAIGTLSRLQSLEVRTGRAPEGLLDALPRLQGPTSLVLAAEALPGSLMALTALQQLRQWKVGLVFPPGPGQGQHCLVLPPPAAFPHLSEYHLNGFSGGIIQVVGQAMRFCRYSVQDRQHSFPIAGIFYDRLYQPHELAISGANADLSQPPRDAELSQPFQAVLASLVPPHQPLRCLSLSKCQLQPAALQDCSALGALSELHLRHCCGQATSLSDALAPLLQQTPRLERLTLHACMQQGDPFPASLLALSGPTFLSLTENFLEGLPEGPCWAGLRRLNLSYNCLRCLPQALSSASQLTSLSISRNERFSLGPEDVEELLAPYLPALQTFDMAHTKGCLRSLMDLARKRPQLDIHVDYVQTQPQ